MSSKQHDWMCGRAAKWLLSKHQCLVSLCEPSSGCVTEYPDAIGWSSRGASHLVEVKVSRSDFHADKKKTFRHPDAIALGQWRWYFAPKGMLKPDDLPPKWGLVELRGSRCYVVKKPEKFELCQTALRREMLLMMAAVRRSHNCWNGTLMMNPKGVEAVAVELAGDGIAEASGCGCEDG